MALLNKFEKIFINKFENAFFIDKNGKIDLNNISNMSDYWITYGNMLITRAEVKKFALPEFTDDDSINQDIAKRIYLFGIDYYNMIKSIENGTWLSEEKIQFKFLSF